MMMFSYSKKMLSTLPLLLAMCTASGDLARHRSTSTNGGFGLSVATSIPRGGGWFGWGNNNNNNNNRSNNKNNRNKKKFPALTQEEIEDKLNIPIFSITSDGNGIAVGSSAGQKEDVVYFFLSQEMAQQALTAMQASNQNIKLQITTLSLGKIWFRLLYKYNSNGNKNRQRGMTECTPIDKRDRTVRKKINFRLVAGARDFFLARLLTSLSPVDAEQLRIAVQEDAKETARDIVTRATAECKQFRNPYNEIPLFMMPQMRMQLPPNANNQEESQKFGGDINPDLASATAATPTLPVFLSAKDMVKAYLHSTGQNNNDIIQNALASPQPNTNNPNAPVVQLIELHELVKLMQQDSDFDFRSMILLTPSEYHDNNNEDDDDNDGGGGDFPLSADSDGDEFEDMHIEMFQNVECTAPWMDEDGGSYASLTPM